MGRFRSLIEIIKAHELNDRIVRNPGGGRIFLHCFAGPTREANKIFSVRGEAERLLPGYAVRRIGGVWIVPGSARYRNCLRFRPGFAAIVAVDTSQLSGRMWKGIHLADMLAVQHINPPAFADQGEAPTGHQAIARPRGPGDDAWLRPDLAMVAALREDDVLIRLAFAGALRPNRHERFVRSIEDEKMFVAGVGKFAAGNFWDKNHVIRSRGMQARLDFIPPLIKGRNNAVGSDSRCLRKSDRAEPKGEGEKQKL